MADMRETWSPTAVLRQTGVVVYEWTIASDTIRWSDNVAAVLGLADTSEIETGRGFTSLISADAETSRVEVALELAAADAGEGAAFEVEYPLALTGENTVWVEDSGLVFATSNGMPSRVIGTLRIVNQRHERQAELKRLSHYDSLTGIYNNARLTELLDEDLKRTKREHSSGAFVVIGICHMDMINIMYGHEVGDEVMREAGKRITSVMRINDSLGRYAGTKLGLVLRGCSDRELLIAGERFLAALRDEVILTSAGPVSLTVNVGGVVYPNSLGNTRNIMGAALEALAEARRAPVPCVHIYEPAPDLVQVRQRNAFTAQEVVDAMTSQRMRLAFQPIVNATTHRVAFHEALIRMVDRSGHIVDAGQFIGVASQLGLIRMVDFCAMKLAVETLQENPDAVLSLNVTNETTVDPEWLSTLATSIAANPEIAPRLIVEITESHVAENLQELIHFVGALQDLGCRVAIDDFGAGYTSFGNLKHLPVDIIKIDGMYVQDLASCVENQVFIKSLLSIAKAFSAEVVVEWVADDQTAELLKSWGVDYLQGDSFGAPLVASPWAASRQKNTVRQARLKSDISTPAPNLLRSSGV